MPRNEYAEFSESFPKLLDALEAYATEKLSGIELGEIEWFHRLRNQLYHQGNGLTVDRDKVEIYSELAKLLFENLFETTLEFAAEDQHQLLGEFLAAWVSFERVVAALSHTHLDKLSTLSGRPRPPLMVISEMVRMGVFEPAEAAEINELRKIRNEVVHGMVDYKTVLSRKVIQRLEAITTKYENTMSEA